MLGPVSLTLTDTVWEKVFGGLAFKTISEISLISTSGTAFGIASESMFGLILGTAFGLVSGVALGTVSGSVTMVNM